MYGCENEATHFVYEGIAKVMFVQLGTAITRRRYVHVVTPVHDVRYWGTN